jgi:hypothetical protein
LADPGFLTPPVAAFQPSQVSHEIGRQLGLGDLGISAVMGMIILGDRKIRHEHAHIAIIVADEFCSTPVK